MRLAVRIQTKGTRERWTELLLDLLEQEIYSKHLDVSIRIVSNKNLWQSCKDTFLSTDENDTHILVLQDDVLPCLDIVETAQIIAELLPNDPVTFFSSSDAVAHALQKGSNWAQIAVWFMAQCYMLPTALACDMVQWIDEYCRQDIKHDDDRMATYMWYHHKKVFVTVPCLVEHIGWNDTTLRTYDPSFVFEPRLRMAKQYIGFEKSAKDIDWRKTIDKAHIDSEGSNSQFCSNLRKPYV